MDKKKNWLDSVNPRRIKVPEEHFFTEMAENIIVEHSNHRVKNPFYKKPGFKWVAAAAVIVPVITVLSIPLFSKSEPTFFAELDQIPRETIKEYIEENDDDVYLAMDVSPQKGNSAISSSSINTLTEEITSEEIVAYLESEYGDWDEMEEDSLYYY